MTKTTSKRKSSKAISAAVASKFLRNLVPSESFHFYTSIGCPLGKSANSLGDFADKLAVLDLGSVRFHFARRDFEGWIRWVIGDEDLGNRIAAVKSDLPDEELRKSLAQTVEKRLEEISKGKRK